MRVVGWETVHEPMNVHFSLSPQTLSRDLSGVWSLLERISIPLAWS